MKTEITTEYRSVNVNVSFEFKAIEYNNFTDCKQDLYDRIKKAMDRKGFGISWNNVWGGAGFSWSYQMENLPESRVSGYRGRLSNVRFLHPEHKEPYMTFECSVNCESIDINGQQFVSTANIDSVKKSIKTVIKNWEKSWAWAFERADDIKDEIFGTGKYADEKQSA